MQFVLNDEVGAAEARDAQRCALVGIARSVEAVRVMAVHQPKERAGVPRPGKCCKLVDRGDHEAGKPAVDRLIDTHDRERIVACEIARVVAARNAKILGVFVVRGESERFGGECRAAPGAFLDRDWGGLRAGVPLVAIGA